MLLRVVHKIVRRSGRVSLREELLDVERPRVGRGATCDIQISQLGVELAHSQLEQRADGIYLVPVDAVDLVVGGRRVPERRLRLGDVARVGSFEITVLPPAAGADLCLELSQVVRRQSEREELEKRTMVGLSRGLFTERKLSWLSVLVIPALFLAVPIIARDLGDTTPPLETMWDSGPIARVHAFIAYECEQCHAVPFQRVRDQECLHCHGEITAHTPAGMEVAHLDQLRCAECHLEHGGERDLAALEEQLCSDCHSDLTQHVSDTEVSAVTDFGDDHPEFRLTVPTQQLASRLALGEQGTGGSADWARVVDRIELDENLQEHSGVLFDHRRHVGQEERADGSGEVLNCGDCHQFDAAGKNMLPIVFEDHCQSCHSISFDSRYEREAFHGDPQEMRQDLLVFYESRELERLEQRIAAGQVLRARVGSEEEQQQRAFARQNALAQVERADAFLMDQERPGPCANCHVVLDQRAADGGYDLAPVELLNLWMPKSVFRHETHDPFPCRDCHPAAAVYDSQLALQLVLDPPTEGAAGVRRQSTGIRSRPDWSLEGPGNPYALFTVEELRAQEGLEPSENATDVLLPSIETCRECHAGAGATWPRVASECVLCHPFHREEYDRMKPLIGPGGGRMRLSATEPRD